MTVLPFNDVPEHKAILLWIKQALIWNFLFMLYREYDKNGMKVCGSFKREQEAA
ncbi:hypothetical protein [Endozoicomonas sp. 8E]|uniref:hypothetical protein n=1 Tax=Endozoicomonas sp. 8E TaxID=3035692 RepID=UPI0029393CB0|nr:hypothetical protein [Endozoicomonas sp. 8E]WOG27756.1 hypothetical protein P6910_24945 [Endozoicomonas sp. 8E]